MDCYNEMLSSFSIFLIAVVKDEIERKKIMKKRKKK
jgi:hypothetical protein